MIALFCKCFSAISLTLNLSITFLKAQAELIKQISLGKVGIWSRKEKSYCVDEVV